MIEYLFHVSPIFDYRVLRHVLDIQDFGNVLQSPVANEYILHLLGYDYATFRPAHDIGERNSRLLLARKAAPYLARTNINDHYALVRGPLAARVGLCAPTKSCCA